MWLILCGFGNIWQTTCIHLHKIYILWYSEGDGCALIIRGYNLSLPTIVMLNKAQQNLSNLSNRNLMNTCNNVRKVKCVSEICEKSFRQDICYIKIDDSYHCAGFVLSLTTLIFEGFFLYFIFLWLLMLLLNLYVVYVSLFSWCCRLWTVCVVSCTV